MINVSNEFRQYLYNDQRNYLVYADITLADGTILNLDSTQIWSGGFKIEDAVSGNTKFEIGSAIANKFTLTINNIYDDFSPYDFDRAVIIAYVGLELSDTTEKIRKGTFIVDDPKYNGTTITLECLDYMSKFDEPYALSNLSYPATIQSVIRNACSVCGVTLLKSDFDNYNYVVPKRPVDDALTFRDAISGCAQLAGCFARCDVWGRLEIKWYEQGVFERNDNLDGGTFHKDGNASYPYGDQADGGTLNPWTVGDKYDGGTFADQSQYHHFYSLSQPTVSTDDVVVTGIQVTENFTESETSKMESVLFGAAGYVLSVENNKWIQKGEAAAVARYLGEKIVGLRFRPLSTSCLSDPTIEAGDLAYVTDRKQNTYHALVTSTTFHKGSYQQVTCGAETPSKNSSTSYSASTKLLVEARRNAAKQISDYDLAVQQLTSLITQSFGVFKSEEVLEDDSTIHYMHDKPTLAESQTIWKMTADAFAVSTDGGKTWNAGMDSSGNAVVNVLNTIGINADWIKAGRIESQDGSSFWDLASGLLHVQGEFYTSDYNHWGEEWISIIDSMIKGGIDSNYDSLIDMCAQYVGGARWLVVENNQSGVRLKGKQLRLEASDTVIISGVLERTAGNTYVYGVDYGHGMLQRLGKSYVSGGYWMQMIDSSGAAFGLMAINTSDERLKKNIEDSQVDALEVINSIRHINYDWIENNAHVENGYSAQQLKSVNSRMALHEEESDAWYFDSNAILQYATKAIQELSTKTDRSEKAIQKLNAKVDRLERALKKAGIDIEDGD